MRISAGDWRLEGVDNRTIASAARRRPSVGCSPAMTSFARDTVLRYSAFSAVPEGGNPAGVVLDAADLTAHEMLAIAKQVGYSETAFLTGRKDGDRSYDVRYFSLEAEVPFCGHATVAAGVALAERDGPGALMFHIDAGPVPVNTSVDADGQVTATLTSVPPEVFDIAENDLAETLELLDWSHDDLDDSMPARIAYAGARHLILAAATRDRLSRLDYDFDGLKALMLRLDLTTVDLVWRERAGEFHARNPFPVGGVVEDPATGAAAAAFGAYLREIGAVTPPAHVRVLQGQDMGRSSELLIDIDADRPEIRVTGTAVLIAA
jgi:PhzF family phenazine biosynthesis protein